MTKIYANNVPMTQMKNKRLLHSSVLLIGIFLLGMSYPFQPYTGIFAPIGSIFALICILFGTEQETNISQQRLLIVSFWATLLLQFSWLLSHPYLYIVPIWMIGTLLLALPLSWITLLWKRSRFFSDSLIIQNIGIATLFVLYESSLIYLFPGISLYSCSLFYTWSDYSIQAASLIGREGLSFLFYFSSLLGATLFYQPKKVTRKYNQKLLATFWIVSILLPYIYGYIRLHNAANIKDTAMVRAGLCHMEEQPDIFQITEMSPWDFATDEWIKVLTSLQPLMHRQESVDIIIIPEGAIPYPADLRLINLSTINTILKNIPLISYEDYIPSLELSQKVANITKSALLIGLEGRSIVQEKQTIYNSAFFITPESAPLTTRKYMRYDKQLLLPFGEYIPFDWMASLLAQYGVHGSFTKGAESKIFLLNNKIPFSPLICYEETFSEYGLECRKKGARFIASLSNDGWFPTTALKRLHYDLAKLQAAELGIPVLRATNQGISGAIDGFGKTIVAHEGSFGDTSFLLSCEAPLMNPDYMTPFVRFWSMPKYILIILKIIFFAIAIRTIYFCKPRL